MAFKDNLFAAKDAIFGIFEAFPKNKDFSVWRRKEVGDESLMVYDEGDDESDDFLEMVPRVRLGNSITLHTVRLLHWIALCS